jgi:hypothetical protein
MENFNDSALLPDLFFVQGSWDGDAESLMYFDSLHVSCSLI